jgi:hypothetical protein
MEFSSDIKKFKIYVHTVPVNISSSPTSTVNTETNLDSVLQVTLGPNSLLQAAPNSFSIAPNSVDAVNTNLTLTKATLVPVNYPSDALDTNVPIDTPADIAYKFSTFPSGYGFVQKDKTVGPNPPSDFHLPIFLTKIYDYCTYVDIKEDDAPFFIERQNVNPFYIEVDFFTNIQRNGLRTGDQLTPDMLAYIKTRNVSGETGYPILLYADNDIRTWFTNVGYFELPWDKGGSFETTLEDIEKISYLTDTIRGKARLLSIDIQK